MVPGLLSSPTPREAWAKCRYEAHFLNKLTDSDGENGETESSLDFAKDCGYCSQNEHNEMIQLNHEVGKMLGTMINPPTPFSSTTNLHLVPSAI